MTLKPPREDGAWWTALMCWAAGWAAARNAAWEPLMIALALVSLFYAAQALRTVRRLWGPDPSNARRQTLLVAACLVPPIFTFGWFTSQWEDPIWITTFTAPAACYGVLILVSSERHAAGRILGMIALSTIAPVTYAGAIGTFDETAVILWTALGGYFLLASIFVMARFRKSRAALWSVRLLSLLVAGTAFFCSAEGIAHWIFAGAFVILSARAWTHHPNEARLDPRRIGKAELVHGACATLITIVALWLGPSL